MSDLWIRSQDKTLLMKTQEIRYNQKEDDHSILAYDTLGVYRILGIYKTKERALEVLDKIQDILIAKNMISLDYKNALGSNFTFEQIQELLKEASVYQMPKD